MIALKHVADSYHVRSNTYWVMKSAKDFNPNKNLLMVINNATARHKHTFYHNYSI